MTEGSIAGHLIGFALPMLLLAALMGFLCLVVSVMANVLDGAVTLQEENDLTI
jgi:hypothetical protein